MSLLVWLPLNGNLNNQGLKNLTVINNGATVDNNGKIGKCYSFNGSSNYLRINEKLIDNAQYTISFWMYATNVTANQCIYSSRNVSNGAVNIYLLSTGLRFDYGTNWVTGFKPSANTWYHITFVQDATKIYLYVNGVLNTSTTATTTLSQVSSIATIGCEHINGSSIGTYFSGKLNDFRVWNGKALSPKEIEILSRGLVCHYPLNGDGRGGDNIITDTSPNEVQYTYPSSSYSDKFSKTSTIIPSASQYVLSFWAKSTHAGDKVRAHWYSPNTTTKAETNQGSISNSADGAISFTLSDKWEKYWCVWTQSSTTAVKHFIFPRMFSQASGEATGTGTVSVKCVKLEEGNIPTPWMPNPADSAYTAMGYNSTTEYDVSGYGYNGTKNGTIAYLTDTPRYNVSTNIKGASSYIQIPNLTTTGFSNSYSFAWWGKVPSYQGYMMWGFSDGQRLNGIFNGNLWNTGDGANNPLYVPGTTTQVTVPTTKVWHHWVMTGDGTTCKVYQDGVLWGQAKTYKSISGTTIYINGWDSSTSYTYGDYQMSDFRIYATALSAAQVAELYNTAVSVANNGTLMGYELVEV